MLNLRPDSFKDFIGQEHIKNNLIVFLSSSKKREENLDHVLLAGVAGVGKTSLSKIIAKELDVELKIVQGPHLQKASDLMSVLTTVKEDTCLFIDEIHAISKEVEEILYSVMEDFKVDITIGKEMNTKIVRVNVPKFTLLSATTKVGELDNSLLDRFGIIFVFEEYGNKEISQIIKNNCKKYSLEIEEKAAEIIASHSRNNPRIANQILRRTIDYVYSKEKSKLTTRFTNYALDKMGYKPGGLKHEDLRYLKILEEINEPVGLDNLAVIMNLPKKTIQDKIESFLIKKMFIMRTVRGRVLTTKGTQYLKNLIK